MSAAITYTTWGGKLARCGGSSSRCPVIVDITPIIHFGLRSTSKAGGHSYYMRPTFDLLGRREGDVYSQAATVVVLWCRCWSGHSPTISCRSTMYPSPRVGPKLPACRFNYGFLFKCLISSMVIWCKVKREQYICNILAYSLGSNETDLRNLNQLLN